MPTSRKLLLVALVVVLGIGMVLGWTAHRRFGPAIKTVQQTFNDPAVSILRQALAKISAHDKAVTARSTALLDSLSKVRAELHGRYRAEMQAETVFVAAVRDTGVSRDSLRALCSVVVQSCQMRADRAEQALGVLQAQLGQQVALQPHRWGFMAVVGPTYSPLARRASVLGITVGVGVQLH